MIVIIEEARLEIPPRSVAFSATDLSKNLFHNERTNEIRDTQYFGTIFVSIPCFLLPFFVLCACCLSVL